MIKRISIIAGCLLTLVLAACQTEPPTNVTQNSATLNARGNCSAGLHANWWYEARDKNPTLVHGSGPGPWFTVGPVRRIDCSSGSAEGPIDSQYFTYPTDHAYQYRVAYQVDGQPQGVCDRTGACAQKGSSSEASLSYDEVNPPVSDNNSFGKDYDASNPTASVSATYACDYDNFLKPGVLIGDYTRAGTLLDCRNTMDLKVTCKVRLWVGSDFRSDVEYGHPYEGNQCGVEVKSGTLTLGNAVGSRHDMYIRLNNTEKRWTSSFRKAPHRGGCETYFTDPAVAGGRYHVMHCWARYGDPPEIWIANEQ